MKYKLSKHRITLLIVLFPLAVLIIYGLMSYLLFSNIRQNDILQEVKSYGQSIYINEKERLKEKVEMLCDSVRAHDQLKREKINQNLTLTLDACTQIINNIYHFHRGKKSSVFIQKEILAALKKVHLTSPYTPIFVMNTSGYVYVHYDRTLKNRVITHVKDQYGVAFVQEFNRMIAYEGKGFVAYSWYKPGNNRGQMYDYLAYLEKIDFKNWYIGASISIEDVQHEIEGDILSYIKAHAVFAHGFFFVIDAHENILFAPEQKLSKRLMKAAKSGFFTDDKNLYYGKYIKEYGWYIVAARELKNIGESLEQKQVELLHSRENTLKKKLLYLGIGLLLSILFSLYLSYVIYRQIKNYEERINESNDKMMFRTRQALIGELFSMIAHQWRQPINKIASILVLMRSDLQSDKCSPKALDKSCEEIEESIEYMSETIEDFRTFYKPATTQKRVNLKTLINKSVTFLNTPIQKHNITVVQNLAEDIEITLYRNEFLQVMLNIIKNAIDATGENGMITIRLHRHGKKIIISVENTGEPIKEHVMRKIFQPYFTTKKESMGLGLYMTKIIVEKHMKGEILIERLEHGTKFIIIL